MLQVGVGELRKWKIECLLNLNMSKCKVISFGRNFDKTHIYKISDKDTDVPIERVDTIRDYIEKLHAVYLHLYKPMI